MFICTASKVGTRSHSLQGGAQLGALGVQDEGPQVEEGDPIVTDGEDVR